jgi:hypothetical protein
VKAHGSIPTTLQETKDNMDDAIITLEELIKAAAIPAPKTTQGIMKQSFDKESFELWTETLRTSMKQAK